ncbi:30S ribosomal protein S6 [Leptolyngbya sp. FACHB-261]|uniref:30S ribosomal protein S6 n=1 Tax=Leptolyngbya sp. FACHB-261 TaxID=2692806 RepID=UPI0016831E0C|nr:30S ribosomal protein S6 [Leptolyngbya sp. FACHB-261]MBD2103791.1 30S ribosomal protein S6 [Leptolyngbya sp. FACHB-261]
MTKSYETMYILRPDLSEEQMDQAIDKYQKQLGELGATTIDTQHRGRRRLAYEINNHRDGIYIQMNYQGEQVMIDTLERSLRLSDEVIRYLTIRRPETKAAPAVTDEQPDAEASVPDPAETSSAAALQTSRR